MPAKVWSTILGRGAAYVDSLRQSPLPARCFVAVVLAVAALLFLISRNDGDAGHLEKVIVRKLAQGQTAVTEVYVRLWEPRAARMNALLGLGLALCWPVLNRRLSTPAVTLMAQLGADEPSSSSRSPSRWFWIAAAGWIVAVSAYDAQRLDLSLWSDEEATMRQCVVGSLAKGEDGQAVLKPVPWIETFFNYRRPNNHILYSVLAKACHSWYPSPASLGPGDTFFSAPLLRLPAFIAGVGSLFVVLWLGLLMGGRRLGLTALMLFSLHPWFTRYSTEARAYGLLFLLTPMLWLALVKGAADGRWRWWLLLALSSLLILWAWPLSLWLVLSANAAAVILVWQGEANPSDRWTLLGRWFICQFAAGMVFLQVFLPNIIQMRQFVAANKILGPPMTLAWLADATSALFTGSSWVDHDPQNPIGLCWERVWDQNPSLVIVTGLLLALIFVAGVVRLYALNRVGRWLLPTVLLPLTITLLFAKVTHSVIFIWYLSPYLPGIALIMAAGTERMAMWFTSRSGWQVLIVGSVCLAFAMMTQQRRRLQCQYSVDPNKEAALLVHKVLNPFSPTYASEPPVGGYYMPIDSYVPFVELLLTADQLRERRAAMQASGKEYFVIVGNGSSIPRLDASMMKELNESGRWDLLTILFGTESSNARAVYKSRK